MTQSSTSYLPVHTRTWWLMVVLMAIPTYAMIERMIVVLGPRFSVPYQAAGWILITYMLVIGFGLPQLLQNAMTWSSTHQWTGVVLFMLLLTVGFSMVYPLADSGVLGFVSDRDEALDVAIRQMLQGGYPYDCRAVSGVHYGCPQSGTFIAPLPGGLLLAMPFVLLGGSGGASVGVLLIIVCWLSFQFQSIGLGFLLLVLVGMPMLVAEMWTGGDHLANALLVTGGLWGSLRARKTVYIIIWSVMLGLALAWRLPFLLVGIPLLVAFAKKGCPKNWWVIGSTALVVALGITLPFYLHDPSGFDPFQTQGKLDVFTDLLPNPLVWAGGSSLLVGIILGWKSRTEADLFMAMGYTLAVPFFWAVVLHSIKMGFPTADFYGWYLAMPAILVCFGWVQQFFGPTQALVNE